MADRELIAAILTAGMLPTMKIPQSRAQGKGRLLTKAEADAIQRAVDHAFGLYRLVLNGLGVDPLAGLPEQSDGTMRAQYTGGYTCSYNLAWRKQSQ
jgi:hypothetical protein